MYGQQEYGPTEIIPLIFTLAIQGQHPIISHHASPQGVPFGVAARHHPLMGGILLVLILRSLRLTIGNNCGGLIWLPRWYSDKELICQWRRYKRLPIQSLVRKIPWRRKWQPTPVFLPGQRSLGAYSHQEQDMIEQLSKHTRIKNPALENRTSLGAGKSAGSGGWSLSSPSSNFCPLYSLLAEDTDALTMF